MIFPVGKITKIHLSQGRSYRMTKSGTVLRPLFLVALMAVAGCAQGPVGNPAVPEPAKAVDLQKYLGRWYEIARYEAGFQKDCEAVTADYTLRPDGKIKVVNSCRRERLDAPIESAEAQAYVVEDTDNAKLRVSFFWPFYGNYWVLDHGETYDWSIIGEPSGRYLWLLFRTPHPTEALEKTVKTRASDMGYDLGLLRPTKQ
jgi:apolipoprotein D and lipocalin family protein